MELFVDPYHRQGVQLAVGEQVLEELIVFSVRALALEYCLHPEPLGGLAFLYGKLLVC